MYTLPAKTPGEAKLVTFDFTSEAAEGTTLATPTVAKSVLSGTDPDAVSLTVGSASVVSGAQQARALVSGGLNGVTYQLVCTVQASNSEVHQIIAQLAVSDDAA